MMKSSFLAALATSSLLFKSCSAFLPVHPTAIRISKFAKDFKKQPQCSELKLVPLSHFSDELTFFSEPDDYRCCIDQQGNFNDGEDVYELALVEEEDLPDLARFVVNTFGADAIRISQDMNAFEKMLMSPAAELLNGYSSLVAFAEVFSGTKQRLTDRLSNMSISKPILDGLTRKQMIDKVEKDSLVLALAKQVNGKNQIVGSIELRLQVRTRPLLDKCT